MDERSIEMEKSDEIMLPGFRFHPTDEELVSFYLKRKIQQRPLSIELIKQLDIYKFDPWDLPKLASTGEKEWYFFCPRDRKYRNSARPNRVTGAGFWKATGTDRPIYSSEGTNRCIGLKKSLVFYKGRAAKGAKTDWMMHEFRLPSLTDNHSPAPNKTSLDKSFPVNDSWAICRIFKKPNSTAQRALSRSWVSPLPAEPIPFYPQPSSSPENISISASTKTASSPAISLCSSNIGLLPSIQTCFPYTNLTTTLEQQLGGGQNIGYRYSNVDISSLLLNMASSETGDFGGSSRKQQTLSGCYYNYLVNNNDNSNFQPEIEENNIGNGHEMKNLSNESNNNNQWEMARSLGFAFGFAVNNNVVDNVGDAWKSSNSLLEHSSLTEYSTSYSTARC